MTHTEQDTTATAKAVVLHLTLCPDKHPESSRWSRRTLWMTQGWAFDTRVRVFALAMAYDARSTRMVETVDGQHYIDASRLRAIREEYGDDGGYGRYPE